MSLTNLSVCVKYRHTHSLRVTSVPRHYRKLGEHGECKEESGNPVSPHSDQHCDSSAVAPSPPVASTLTQSVLQEQVLALLPT